MGAKTVTFAIQIGSGGFEIARLVAERLKFRYYDWEVTSQVAAEAGVSPATVAAAERAPSLLERIMERLLITDVYGDDEVLGHLSITTMDSAMRTLDSRDYREFIERVVRQLAEAGEAVVVGHMGQVVLRQTAGVLKVLVCGSVPKRAERLAAEAGLTDEAALTAVRASDQDRVSFFKRIYSVDLVGALPYDICLNTDQMTLDCAADLVLAAAANLPGLAPEIVSAIGAKSPSLVKGEGQSLP